MSAPRCLFVMDPLDRIHVDGDSTWMLLLEARARGWPCWFCTPDQLYAEDGIASARCQTLEVSATAPHFDPGAPQDRKLGDFDVIWMRKDPPFDMDYIFSTYLLDLAPPSTVVLNHPTSIRSANEKLFTLRFPQFITPTLITRDIPRILRFAKDAPGRIVLKPWDGNGGRGVLVSQHGDPNLRSMSEILTTEGTQHIIVQHYIPEIVKGDKRVILINGEPVGQMMRVPSADDHRGNMHVGATVEACELTPRDQAICATLGPVLREMGLLFVGIDIIGDFLTEINVTSPTGLQEIRALTGDRLEVALTDAVAARVAAARAQESC
mgnify:CR=1 FL=1